MISIAGSNFQIYYSVHICTQRINAIIISQNSIKLHFLGRFCYLYSDIIKLFAILCLRIYSTLSSQLIFIWLIDCVLIISISFYMIFFHFSCLIWYFGDSSETRTCRTANGMPQEGRQQYDRVDENFVSSVCRHTDGSDQ